jgi:hypothetical protein
LVAFDLKLGKFKSEYKGQMAKYLTILPPKEEFEKRLHKAIENAKQKYQIKD